jgi:hypothetical protein
MSQLLSSQEFIENVALLIIGAVLTGILVPGLKLILDYINFRKQRLFEHELGRSRILFEGRLQRQKSLTEAQTAFLEAMSQLLWEFHALIAKVSYYGKMREEDNSYAAKYEEAVGSYEERLWELLIVKIQAEISKAQRLTAQSTYEELKRFYRDVLVTLDSQLVDLINDEAVDINAWDEFHEIMLKERLVQAIDSTLIRLADDMQLSINECIRREGAMSESDAKDSEQLRFARQQLEKERAHRREKVWKIFSWAATLLVAITGGVIALKTDPPASFQFSWWLRGVLTASVLLLMGFARLWITQNLAIMRATQEAIDKCDEELLIEKVIPDKAPRFGYDPALVMLAIAAIVAIVIEV